MTALIHGDVAGVANDRSPQPADSDDDDYYFDLDHLGSTQDVWGMSVFDGSEFLPGAQFIDRQLCRLAGDARLARGLTQAELAHLLDMSQSAIARFETGRQRAPNWRLFREIVGRLGFLPEVRLIPLSSLEAEALGTPRATSEALEAWGPEAAAMGTAGGGAAATSTVRVGGVPDNPPSRPGSHGFETLAIHAGQEPDAGTGAVVPPVHLVSTFAQDGVGGLRGGYEYSRSGNPTRAALEECLAAIEGVVPGSGGAGFGFASGLAAEDALLRSVCRPGDHVVIPGDAYGGTYRLFARVLSDWGLQWTAVDQHEPQAVAAAMRDETKLVWCETPTNPLLTVSDIAALAEIAHARGALLAVDNTFASPYLQQPLPLGADVVMHSTTKYLGGHSDVVGGALIASDPEVCERIGFIQNATGAVAGPLDAWLVLRGIKTLAVRMERHCDNAEAVVAMLRERGDVTEVLYPDRDEVAKRQMRRFGGMAAFRVGDAARAVAICGRTTIFTLAESLGGVESLIEHPGRMTHASAAGSELEVPDDLIRLSVGLESRPDLLADLQQALDQP